ncbi:hypothetical protein B0H14DRAFT_2638461 [Mycena olivaceomarginata]|nr:hypothetical protein B0H14DRAFT_2638461 [Mycena olivaceomarginata]
MLWTLYSQKTRSGTIFATWTLSITSLQAANFDFGPLLSRAVSAESDDQEDSEPHDALNDINEEWPPNPLNDINEDWPPHDPWNDVDDLPLPPAAKKAPCITQFLTKSLPPDPHRKETITAGLWNARTRLKKTASHLPIHVPSFNASTLPTVHGAYAAKVKAPAEKRGHKQCCLLAELIGLGFQLVRWDGIAAHPLSLAGQPDNSEWRAAVARAYDSIKTEGSNTQFPTAMCCHRHGLFAAINVRLVYGKGQRIPTWLDNKQHMSVVDRLLGNPDVNCLANFASFAFSLWAPQLHSHYFENNAKVQIHLPHLHRPFPKSIFSSTAFNFGPCICTFKHRDVCNLPFRWCAIQSLGTFDATKGGHLVLWDLKLVVEFPAGALILLPSATLAHSNTPVDNGQERISFTQFTGGGLFRYIDNRGRTAEELEREDPAEYARLMARRETLKRRNINARHLGLILRFPMTSIYTTGSN